jgi:HEAT repeat protein
MAVDQEEIHRLSLSENVDDRLKAAKLLGHEFSSLPDKSIAWSDLHRLTMDENSDVRGDAASALFSSFVYVPDKFTVWSDLHRLTFDNDSYVREVVADGLGSIFSFVSDKSAAWDDLIRLINDNNSNVRALAVDSLDHAFPHVPNKDKSWNDLHKLINYSNLEMRVIIAENIVGDIFPIIPDKQTAWNDLIVLIRDYDPNVGWYVAEVLDKVYHDVPDKYVAWDDLHKLTNHEDTYIKQISAETIGRVFSLIPDKCAAWDDLHRLLKEYWSDVSFYAADAIISIVSDIPYLPIAWNELHEMASNKNNEVRLIVAEAIGNLYSFSHDEYKSVAWNDLHGLLNDPNLDVKIFAASSLESIIPLIPEEYKSVAWSELHKLTNDEDWEIRGNAAHAIGSTFSSLLEEYRCSAFSDLQKLASDEEDSNVIMYANHSLGKICIYKASESEKEEDSKALLAEAIQYFEKAANEYSFLNPARFCYLFYSSFDAVVFKKVSSKEEIDGYIEAAKKEIRGSESKQKLIEAIEQLAAVLETVQNGQEDGIEYQELLKRCSDICNRVDLLMDENKEKTPAICGLYGKFRPSFRKTIKEFIDDIKRKAEEACREARGTPDAEAACQLYRESQKLDEAADSEINMAIVESMAFIVKGKVNKNPEYHYLLPTLDKLDSELNFNRKLSIIRDILGVVEFGSSSQEISGKLDSIYETVQTTALNIDQLMASIKQIEISLKPGIKEEIQVTVGLSALGSGAQHVITIPLQEIHYAELKEDIQKYADKMLDIGKLPRRLKDRIITYIRKNKDKLE